MNLRCCERFLEVFLCGMCGNRRDSVNIDSAVLDSCGILCERGFCGIL